MFQISLEIKERIRSAIDLRDLLLSEGVPLRRSGGDIRGDCPFERREGKVRPHSDRFRVRAHRYNCFGCGRSGDVFTWFQEWHGLSFPQSVRAAAERAGIALEQLQGQRRKRTDPHLAARYSILAALADLSISESEALSAETSHFGDIELTPLVQNLECGKLPSEDRIRDHLQRLGYDEGILNEIGLGSGVAFSDRWVLWVRERSGAVRGGRFLGDPAGVFGLKGQRTPGWICSSSALFVARVKKETLIAADEWVYLAARRIGVENVFLPLNRATLDLLAPRLACVDSKATPPIILVRPTPEGRRQALKIALQLQRINPRVRVCEIDPLPKSVVDVEQMKSQLAYAIARAGTIFDWQALLLARYGLLDSPEDRRRAARKLSRIVTATREPLERAVYLAEIENLTGYRPEEIAPGKPRLGSVDRRMPHKM